MNNRIGLVKKAICLMKKFLSDPLLNLIASPHIADIDRKQFSDKLIHVYTYVDVADTDSLVVSIYMYTAQ